MDTIYLDNAATTRPHDEVTAAMENVSRSVYGNPSALHRGGMEAEKQVKAAQSIVAGALGVVTQEIVFTSGGTESNNLAILGFALANRKRGGHIVTTAAEHPSVSEPIKFLSENGFEVSTIAVDSDGYPNMEQLERELRADTIFVSMMHVNNETGAVFPVGILKDLIKTHSPNAALHVDAVQSFGKVSIPPMKCGIDLLSVSAHKLHGPKGVGALYVRKGTIIKPIMFGGGQQGGLRSGTENVPGIVGFGKAVEVAVPSLEANMMKIAELKRQLQNGIMNAVPDVVLNSPHKSTPYILNMSFLGTKAEILLHSLEGRGVYVSAGSACSSNKPAPSKTLTAMGRSKREVEGALRFSLSTYTTGAEIDACIDSVAAEVTAVRKAMGSN